MVDTLEPATMATSGRVGFAKRLAQGIELGGQQRAGAGDRREFRDTVGGRLGAMRGAERVVDIDVAQRGHFSGQFIARSFSRPC